MRSSDLLLMLMIFASLLAVVYVTVPDRLNTTSTYTYAHVEDIQDLDYHRNMLLPDTIAITTEDKSYGVIASLGSPPIVSNSAENSTVKWVAVDGEVSYELGAIHLTAEDYKKLSAIYTDNTGYTLAEPSLTESAYLDSLSD